MTDQQLTPDVDATPPTAVPGHAPEGTLEHLGNEWAPGVHPVVVSPRSRRFRWGVAASLVAIVVLVTAAGTMVLSGGAGAKSLTSSVAPRNTVFFMEIRTDLPGDQRSNLASFMSYFPGFKDRSLFDNALDDMLNKLTGSVSPDLRYTSAFKPWMEGEVSIAVQDPTAGSGGGSATCTGSFGGMVGMSSLQALGRNQGAVAIFALKDRSAAATWVSGELTRLGVTANSQTYAGTTLYTFGAGEQEGAYALTAQDLVIGTVAGVKASLDSATVGSLADSATYQAAMKSASGDSLARFYVDVKTLVAAGVSTYQKVMCAMPGVVMASLPPMNTDRMPAWVSGSIRAETNSIVVATNMPRPAGMTASGNHSSRIAASLPASTVAVFEAHGIGTSLSAGLSALQSAAPAAGLDTSSLDNVQKALFLIGGLDWIGDGTAVVTSDGTSFGGGIVIETPDAATATAKLGTIRSLIGLSGIATGISSRTETYKGSSITVVTIPASMAGEQIDLALGVKDNLVVAGYKDGFVKAFLDTAPSNSLATQPDYKAATNAAGDSNEAFAYVNVSSLADQIGRSEYSSNPSTWTLYYKPYFDHLAGIAWAVVDGSTVTVRLVVTAR